MYHFLDLLWNKHKEECDDLGGLLGAMNPYLFSGGLPIDHVMLTDWLDFFKEGDIMREEADVVKVFEMMIGFLQKQETNFGIDLKIIIDQLNEINEHDDKGQLWHEWINICTTSYK